MHSRQHPLDYVLLSRALPTLENTTRWGPDDTLRVQLSDTMVTLNLHVHASFILRKIRDIYPRVWFRGGTAASEARVP